MGFLVKAKHGLNQHGGEKTKFSLQKRENRREGVKEKEKRRGRGRRRIQAKIKPRYGTLDFCMELHGIRKFV